jgi:hypothetical protein
MLSYDITISVYWYLWNGFLDIWGIWKSISTYGLNEKNLKISIFILLVF